ncbi:MAG: hypothetical protein PVF49_13280, partial [Anaerolineales bacterium]
MDSDRTALGSQPEPLQGHKQRSRSWGWMLWIAPLAFLGLFYFYPLTSILLTSFQRGTGGNLILLEVLRSPITADILWFTVWQALLSTVLTLVVGLPGAYLLARFRFRGKTLLRALTGIPFVLPTIVVAA